MRRFWDARDQAAHAPAPTTPAPLTPLQRARKCLSRGQSASLYNAAIANYLEGLLILAVDAREDDVVE